MQPLEGYQVDSKERRRNPPAQSTLQTCCCMEPIKGEYEMTEAVNTSRALSSKPKQPPVRETAAQEHFKTTSLDDDYHPISRPTSVHVYQEKACDPRPSTDDSKFVQNWWKNVRHLMFGCHCIGQKGNEIISDTLDYYEDSVTLDRRTGEPLGIDVDHSDGIGLVVVKVSGGVTGIWNKARPSEKVKPGDRIVEVNGVRGVAWQMIAECKKNKVLNLKLRRE